jgi:simple sugar transport system substrate-binding protein
MMLRQVLMALGTAIALALAPYGVQAQSKKPTMGIVVKIGGIPWFNAMEMGIKEQGEKLGVAATMIGPTSADPGSAGPRHRGPDCQRRCCHWRCSKR